MITVERGKEHTSVELEGTLGDLIMESISVVESIRCQIVDKIEKPEEVIFHYVNELIDTAWGKK